MPCIKTNFMFLMTGIGKGLFNIFVGAVLFISDKEESSFSADKIMAWAMIAAGGVFLFLSMVKKMTDDELHEALGAMASKDSAQAKSAAKKGYQDNKETIHSGAR